MIGNKPGRSTIAPAVNEENLTRGFCSQVFFIGK